MTSSVVLAALFCLLYTTKNKLPHPLLFVSILITLSNPFFYSNTQVHIRSSMLIDGVCIRWRGWIDLQRLDGNGCLEYDEERGRIEDAILKEQIEQYKMRMREFEERQRLYKLAQAEHQKKTASAISATTTGPQPPPPLSQQPPPPSLPTPAATTATATSNISKSEVNLNRKKLYFVYNLL